MLTVFLENMSLPQTKSIDDDGGGGEITIPTLVHVPFRDFGILVEWVLIAEKNRANFKDEMYFERNVLQNTKFWQEFCQKKGIDGW